MPSDASTTSYVANPKFIGYPTELTTILTSNPAMYTMSPAPEYLSHMKSTLYVTGVDSKLLLAAYNKARKILQKFNDRKRHLVENDPWARYKVMQYLALGNTPERRDHIIGLMMTATLMEYVPFYVSFYYVAFDPNEAVEKITKCDSLIARPHAISVIDGMKSLHKSHHRNGYLRPEVENEVINLTTDRELTALDHARWSAELRFAYTLRPDGSLPTQPVDRD